MLGSNALHVTPILLRCLLKVNTRNMPEKTSFCSDAVEHRVSSTFISQLWKFTECLLFVSVFALGHLNTLFNLNFCCVVKIEITSKLDFIWRRKFGVEKEEVETMGSLNKVLLENILPAYVADHFLSSPHRRDVSNFINWTILTAGKLFCAENRKEAKMFLLARHFS